MQIELRTRFRENLVALTHSDDATDCQRLGIAVSGGPDSMALLAMAHELWGKRVMAATVDHQLRLQSAAEADMVAQFCASWGIGHHILTPDQPIGGNVQSAARAVRYQLLKEWAQDHDIAWIATAHHADDQLETLLMRLARGAGLDGLSGVRARNGPVIRPLLDCTKADLVDYCTDLDVPFVHDPSNSDSDFERVRVRAALEKCDILDPVAAVRSASALAEAGEALEWIAAREAQVYLTCEEGEATLAQTGYPREILRRLLLRGVQLVSPGHVPRGTTQTRALDMLQNGGKTMIGDVICEGGECWTFRPAPPRTGK